MVGLTTIWRNFNEAEGRKVRVGIKEYGQNLDGFFEGR